MKFAWLNNPHNLWGKWVRLTQAKQCLTLLLLAVCLLYYPLMQFLQLWQEVSETQTELQLQQEKLTHRQQIARTLKQKSDALLLTPQLAAQLSPTNQLLRELAADLHIENSQWTFQAQPMLTLQIEGNFTKIKQFLTALLAQAPQLELIRLHIYRAEKEREFSLQSDILFQFRPYQEKL